MPGASYINLSYLDVALAAALILINVGISLALRLGMGRSLAVAAIRTVVQLLLVGLVLQWVFELSHWYAVFGVMSLMTLVAGITAVERNERRWPGVWWDAIGSVWASAWAVTLFALLVILRENEPWYRPQYAIPLLGMVLGNTLNGVTLGLGTLGEGLATRRDQIEALLALGATRWEAAREAVAHAVRTGLVPIVNSMMVVGIVSLPGMMTGQLLSGTSPIEAVKYQIVIMFLIASGTGLGTVGIVLLGYRRLFNARHQFLYGKLRKKG